MANNTFSYLRGLGVLGMNSRNSDYIMRCNPRSLFPLVDNKVFTKQLAQKHNIPTPSLYHVIEHHGDIAKLGGIVAEREEFVIKPARGAGGHGIILISGRSQAGFTMPSGDTISVTDLAYHVSDILSGIYSLSGLEDTAIVEALMHPDPVFSAISYKGVPDIRIIVYRGVPVMGMLRLPTRASDGKANLHRGAIGAGIDIANGMTLSAVHNSHTITHHPDTGMPVRGVQVPFWDNMLLMAAAAFDMTGLGYIGVDMVIDAEQGPVLLELNARPGLAIQIANMSGLHRRLDEVDKAPENIFASIETRAAWAKEIFLLK